MKKKFRSLLSERCKDMGLTDKAIDALTDLGANGMADDATEEDIAGKVDSLVPFAKAMQAEITRKTRKTQSSKSQSEEGEQNEGETTRQAAASPQPAEAVPQWAKELQSQFNAIKAENDKLRNERAKSERMATIASEAKKRGIPDYLMKRVTLAEDADIVKELDDFKQELVTNNLMPKGQAHEAGTTEEQMKADAKAWAKTLPDK